MLYYQNYLQPTSKKYHMLVAGVYCLPRRPQCSSIGGTSNPVEARLAVEGDPRALVDVSEDAERGLDALLGTEETVPRSGFWFSRIFYFFLCVFSAGLFRFSRVVAAFSQMMSKRKPQQTAAFGKIV